MRYEIIGWVDDDDKMYPPHGELTASVDLAVINEIKKHDYCFYGHMHEEYAPLLNDGTIAQYSTRDWGRIMALAHGNKDDYGYLDYYYSGLERDPEEKTPDGDLPEDYRIVPKKKLVDVFEMHLLDDEFEALKNGQKTIDIRLFDDKRKQIDFGDYIRFKKASDESQSFLMEVENLDLEQSFSKMFIYLKNHKKLNELGYQDYDTFQKEMYQFYTEDKEREFGVIALYLKKPTHLCITYFGMWFNKAMRAKMYRKIHSQDIKGVESFDDESINKILDDDYEKLEKCAAKNDIKDVLDSFVEYKWFWDWYRIGYNEEYDVDINVMLRKTLKELFGKEELLKKIQYEYCVPMTLDIFVTIIEKSEKQKPKLELDKDILEFLEKSNIELRIEKKVI